MRLEKIITKTQKALDKHLYTISMDFRGGTYIYQIQAESELESIRFWAASVEISNIKYFGNKTKSTLAQQLESEGLTQLDDCQNVWIACFDLLGYFTIVHVIKTVEL